MALITCPECTKEISDKATSCPNCGCPIAGNLDVELKKEFGDELQFPDIPPNPSIGKQITNWGGDAYFAGEFRQDENVVDKIEPGKVKIIMHKEGIAVSSTMYTPYMELHFKQIINTKQTTTEEITKTNKSVVGRAVVGGLLMGPVGAIVGGMSGMNKDKLKNTNYLVINYWDLETKKAQTLLIRGKKSDIGLFVTRMTKEQEKSKDSPVTEKKDEKGGCAGVVTIIVLIAGTVGYLLTT
jgi:hypothetical protein